MCLILGATSVSELGSWRTTFNRITNRAHMCTRLHQSTGGKGWPVTSEVEPLLFGDFSAAPLSRAAISTKIKDPNGAGPAGDERSMMARWYESLMQPRFTGNDDVLRRFPELPWRSCILWLCMFRTVLESSQGGYSHLWERVSPFVWFSQVSDIKLTRWRDEIENRSSPLEVAGGAATAWMRGCPTTAMTAGSRRRHPGEAQIKHFAFFAWQIRC